MTAIETITLFAPIIASSGIFATRRMGKGIDALDDHHPLYGISNFVIAGGQTLKALQAAGDMANISLPNASESITALSNGAKGLSKSSPVIKGLGKILNIVSQNVNKFIGGASLLKIAGSDDKADTAVRELLSLSAMFGCENLYKNIAGMPYTEIAKNGIKKTLPRTALYKNNPFLKKQADAIFDYCMEKKLFNMISLKPIPGALKGVLFVLASIGGYKLGSKIAEAILGKEKDNKTKKK